MRKYCLFILFFLLFTACVKEELKGQTKLNQNPETRPQWTKVPPKKAGFVFGVGSADIYGDELAAIKRAQENAKVELLSQLRVSISSELQINTQMKSRGEDTSIEKLIRQETMSRVKEIEISGINVQESWSDSKRREAWALASLNKEEAERNLLSSLVDMEKQILERGLGKGSNLDRIRHTIPSLKQLEERKHILQQLSFLSGKSSLPEASRRAEIEEFQSKAQGLLENLSINLESKNKDARQMQAMVIESLNKMGFAIHKEKPDLIISLDISLTPVYRNSVHHMVSQANGQIRTAEGRIIKSVNESGRSSSTDPDIARKKAVENMAEKIADALAQSLFYDL